MMEELSDSESSESVIYLGGLSEVSSSEESEIHLPWVGSTRTNCESLSARSGATSDGEISSDSSEPSELSLSWSNDCSVLPAASWSPFDLAPRHSTPVCNKHLDSRQMSSLSLNRDERLPLQGESSYSE